MMNHNIKLTLQYDGTGFNGWQVQAKHKDARTVQGVLEAAVSKINGSKTSVTGAGRTDSGVHALGQVANFFTEKDLPVSKWPEAINSLLPPDVIVLNAEKKPEEFHARLNAVGKTYKYYIINSKYPDIFIRNHTSHIPHKLDIDKVFYAAKKIEGTHNFKSFCASGSSVKHFERNVFDVSLELKGDILVFSITADGFLYKMVRMIVGTLIEIGKEKKSPEWISEILETEGREKGGPTAPARGLYLEKVYYNSVS